MKQYNEPIQVEVGDDGLPTAFRWRDRAWNVISVTDRWVLQAGWWRSGGVEKRDYVLVETEGMDGAGDGEVGSSENLQSVQSRVAGGSLRRGQMYGDLP
jgi:hypothetical protein